MFLYHGRIPKEKKLQSTVVTDVYTGTDDFVDATDAKEKMRRWVGPDPVFFRTLHSMTLKRGYCRIGQTFRELRATIELHPVARPKPLIIIIPLRTILSKYFA
ncbi:MAG TPA: hypothetical protein VIW69_07780 [Candidatus Elarobacter sp.]